MDGNQSQIARSLARIEEKFKQYMDEDEENRGYLVVFRLVLDSKLRVGCDLLQLR